jgi:hypothetical protein
MTYKRKKFKNKKIHIKVDVDIDRALGSSYREQYLEDNPQGYKKILKIHKNKCKYTRKQKYQIDYNL